MKEKDLTTYCGLYCGDCPRYNARFSDLARELLHEFENTHFSEFAKLLEFEHYDHAISLLKVLPGLKCEIPCRLGGDGCGEFPCEVKRCVINKAIEGCWECDDFAECPKRDFLKPFCEEAPTKNLRKINAYGIENWASHREKQYPWM